MRGARIILVAAASGSLALAVGWMLGARQAQAALAARTSAPSTAPKEAPAGSLHRGESAEGSFQEALDAALRAAQLSMPGADGRFEWELVSVGGTRGGIRGERGVVVEIRTR